MQKLANIHKEVHVPDDVEVFFVGDIHGEYNLLMDSLKTAGYNPDKDYLFHVGDMIDRGPDNLACLAKFIFGKPRNYSVMGNHDMFLATSNSRNDSMLTWMHNGGMWSLEIGTDHIEAMIESIHKNIPIFITVHHRNKKYGIVHAEIPLNYMDVGNKFAPVNWDTEISELEDFCKRQQFIGPYWRAIDPYLWGRDVLGYHHNTDEDIPRVDGVDYTLHGHTVQKEPTMVKNRFYIDTGGVFNKKLTVAKAINTGFSVYTSDPSNEGSWKEIN